MSVKTTADEKYDLLKEKFKELRILSKDCDRLIDEILDPEIWGYDDWSDLFKNKMEEIQDDMLQLRKKFREWEG